MLCNIEPIIRHRLNKQPAIRIRQQIALGRELTEYEMDFNCFTRSHPAFINPPGGGGGVDTYI